ncbi:MAG TPA: hypothetical protein VFE50_22740 [Cyclobacteriaceae bacterium]|nr:hypothetical protein [Cyclobacteriaceae bacterium]
MSAKEQDELFDASFSARTFLRALSFREFFTSASLCLLLLAFYELLHYYSNEDWLEDNYFTIKWCLAYFLMSLTHVFYRKEHQRQNNFIGRNLHDYISIVTFIAMQYLYGAIIGNQYKLTFDGIGTVIVWLLLVIISVIVFEVVISIVRHIFSLVGWQVL